MKKTTVNTFWLSAKSFLIMMIAVFAFSEASAQCVYQAYTGADTLGNQLTFKNFSKEHAAYYASRPGALKKIHSGLFLAGSTLADTGTMGLLYLFNGECDTIFTKRFKGDGFTAFYNTDIINDTIYLIGATRDTLGSEVFLYLVALDTFGTTLWEQKIGNGVNAEFGLNVDHFTNGNLLLSGSVDYDDTGMVTDGKIYKTNRSGDPYFSKTYGTPFDDSHQYAKVSINNKSILVQQAIDTIINIGDVEYPRFVGKMDTSGNYIWRTFLNKPIFLDLWNLWENVCLLYTSPSPRDRTRSRMPSSA